MSYIYNTPENETINIKEEKSIIGNHIVSIAIHIDLSVLIIKYKKKYDTGLSDEVFTEKWEDGISKDEDGTPIIENQFTDLISRNGAVQAGLKTGAYNELALRLNKEGTIS